MTKMLSWRGYLLPNPVILLSAFAAGYLNSFQYALPIGRGEGDTLPPVVSALLQDVGNQALVILQSFHTVFIIIILVLLGSVLDSCT